MNAQEFDVAVIGGGSAGYAAARVAAAGGLRTAVIDGARELGGLCILRGCMPTKALLYAAEVLHLARQSATWGLRIGSVGFDWQAVMERKDRMIGDFASYRRQQLSDGRFTLIRSQARFVDPHTVELSDGGRLRAGRFMIATGSVVANPIESLKAAGCITSDDALALDRLPASMIVLGGGAVAVEFAQFFQRMGVRVTLVQRSPHLLRDFDEDAGTTVADAFRAEGMDVHTGTRIVDAGFCAAGRFVEFDQAGRRVRVEAETLLNALGRTANTAGLGLDAAGVRLLPDGHIETHASMRTSAPHIYAGGDCAGPYEIVHLAITQGETAAHNMLHPGDPRLMDYRLLTSVVFTDPAVATVGLTEKEAQRRGVAYRVASYPFNDHGKSMIMEAVHGFVKLLTDPVSGEILGGACVGPHAGELIHEVVVAMSARLTAAQFAAIPHYHPTLAEIWTYPAEELSQPAV